MRSPLTRDNLGIFGWMIGNGVMDDRTVVNVVDKWRHESQRMDTPTFDPALNPRDPKRSLTEFSQQMYMPGMAVHAQTLDAGFKEEGQFTRAELEMGDNFNRRRKTLYDRMQTANPNLKPWSPTVVL